jgi:alanine racemase
MLCLAVKADAYGHGIAEIARAAGQSGVDYLAVATADEGVEIRDAGVELPILLYSLANPTEVEQIISSRITPILCDTEQIALYGAAARSAEVDLPVHIIIDTGMGRIGCTPADAVSVCRAVVDEPALVLGGVSTHFAGADMADRSYTEYQLSLFNSALAEIRRAGIKPGVVHASNSGGVIGYPQGWFDMVRPGLLAYGYYPSDDQERMIEVAPVMELMSQLVYIKEVEAGERISYGMTWAAPQRTWIGTVPVGYGDGYNRLLSNAGVVAIGGNRYPIVGRVCMDQLMVDLGPELRVKRYDEVSLFGRAPAPDAAELAVLCDTIPYEITCAVSRRVPRVYVRS